MPQKRNATQLRNGDQRPTNAGISSILNDPITGLEVRIFTEDQRRRWWVAAELRELQPITVGQREEPLRLSDETLRPGEAEIGRQDVVANLHA